MTWAVEPGRFALLGFPEPPDVDDFAALRAPGASSPPGQVIREGGETTLLVSEGHVAPLLQRHPGAAVEPDLVWIRFHAPMAWDLVGFLALVTGRLAAAGVALGAVCGYQRDHLFLSETHLPAAVRVLTELLGPPLTQGPSVDGRTSVDL